MSLPIERKGMTADKADIIKRYGYVGKTRLLPE